MTYKTADLCDEFGDIVKVAEPLFRHYGGKTTFSGIITTLKIHEDNVLVRNALSNVGAGKVLVVDGGGSLRCALVGDQLAELAIKNQWAGIIVYGCIRDSAAINALPIGIKALNTNPLRSPKLGQGQVDIAVTFAGVTFNAGQYVYADEDGIIVAEKSLK